MMWSGPRDPEAAASHPHDLIVVGGGVYGVCLTLQAARSGLRPLLLERDGIGAATSANTLRILHGGLRYLQHLDVRRFAESVRERQWFLRHFPNQVEPLGCLMPLYGDGLRRPSVLRVALAVNDFLTRRRNDGVRGDRHLPGSRVLDRAETVRSFPGADRDDLRGGALWYDAVMLDPQGILAEMLRWASGCGADVLAGVEATELLLDGNAVRGIEGVDRRTGERLRFRAPVVVNCAGPSSRRLARVWDRDLPHLFRPSLAFNLLLDREPLSRFALAVSPRRPAAPAFFLLPVGNRILAGTRHLPHAEGDDRVEPGEADIGEFLDLLNEAVPGLAVGRRDVVQVHAGLLPAAADGSPRQARRPVIHDHGRAGGPRGLYSVSGVKFTTARAVADRTLRLIDPRRPLRTVPPAPPASRPGRTAVTQGA